MHSDAQHRLRVRQEDPPPSPQWVQEVCSAQRERVGALDDAQQVKGS